MHSRHVVLYVPMPMLPRAANRIDGLLNDCPRQPPQMATLQISGHTVCFSSNTHTDVLMRSNIVCGSPLAFRRGKPSATPCTNTKQEHRSPVPPCSFPAPNRLPCTTRLEESRRQHQHQIVRHNSIGLDHRSSSMAWRHRKQRPTHMRTCSFRASRCACGRSCGRIVVKTRLCSSA